MSSVTTTETRRVRLALAPPHSAGQRELIETPLSVALLAGARFGKTEAGVRRIIRSMSLDPGLYYWVGLSWPSASMQKAWRMLRGHWGKALRVAGLNPRDWINRSRHEITLPNGSMLMLRTAENPESIAGDGPKGVVGDEYTYWPEEVWQRFVQPSLADHNAWAMMIGRPAGEGWGLDLWRSAEARKGWIQRRYTIYDNPLLDPAFIAQLKAETPGPLWEQEYMAESTAGDSGLIPRAWVQAAIDRWKPDDTGPQVLGVDVAEGGGDKAICAIRRGDTIVELRDVTPRKRGEFGEMLDVVERILKSHGGYAMVDTVGVGAMVPSMLKQRGVVAWGFKAGVKTNLRDTSGQFGFNNLRSAAWWHLRSLLDPENGRPIALPNDRELLAELCAPTYDTLAGGKIAVEAKDDIKKRLSRSTDKADAVVQAFFDRLILRPREKKGGENEAS